MHEFSLAQNIIDIANKELEKHGKKHIDEIKLQIGSLSGVEVFALKTALHSFSHLDFFHTTNYEMEEIKAVGCCNQCNTERVLHDFFEICDNCGGTNFKILTGKEFLVKSITMH